MTALQFAEATGTIVALAVFGTLMLSSDRESHRFAWVALSLWIVIVAVIACVNG